MRLSNFPGLPRTASAQNAATTSANTDTNASGSPDSPGLLSPTHEVTGEHFIDPGESAGLPLPLPQTDNPDVDPGESYAQDAASKVVRAHTAQRRSIWGRSRSPATAVRNRKSKGKSRDPRDPEKRRADDLEHNAASSVSSIDISANPRLNGMMGGGVLSTLLTLYDAQQAGGSVSGASTPATLGATTPVTQRDSFSFDVPMPDPDKPWVKAVPPEGSSSRPKARPLSGEGWDVKPKWAQRKPVTPAAGVLGALIASTGNISGVAAPTASTLAPNIKRPGYHLSRYSLESAPTKKSGESSGRIPAKNLKRPSSTHFERVTDGVVVGEPEGRPSGFSERTMTNNIRPSGSSSPMSEDSHSGGVSASASTVWGGATVTGISTEKPNGMGHKRKWTGVLKDLPHAYSNLKSRGSTPTTEGGDEWLEEKVQYREEQRKEEQKKERRRKRKQAEVYITRHVAQILQRQEFVLKLTRAMMMFGGPSHRLQAQIQSTARVLDIELSCMYLPDVMLISFDDSATGTSNIKFIRQGSALDLGKLQDSYHLYWKVIHDELSVSEASAELDVLMRKKPLYNWWQLVLIGAMCSASICSVSFNGSFIDCLIVAPLGGLLVAIQLLSVRNELYSNVFEITIATLLSFLAAALAASSRFCYPAVASSSVVLILPGFIVLIGALEISSRNIVSGAVRLCFALMYSLFLGFGLAIGAEVYESVTSHSIVGAQDYSCTSSHDPTGPWYQQTPSIYWAFLTVPMYSLFLSMRQQAPYNRKELALQVGISCIGWVTNHFAGKKFANQNDISSAVGAFAVGIVSNVYARFFSGNAFVVMITGILFQLPSGLGNGGLLTFASQTTSGSSTSYLSGFETALQLISVSIGLTVGLGIALVVVHPIQSRRRAGGVFSL
ncbi:hypothetical protein PLICRDRAFT_349447 [Plicaturopsis crispa FD-325 SS-3]|uniref:DUF1212-domain-containing protein n=1 Tax=Plicaturopsis crispa FD-325 SS-3 TaxID=944288 RepID=A0A0C9SL68_PLICR|nr:hypothetical protein PLICRDRAFT_349447 [Plicaturopsis crispa FD-325 SS-3]